MGAGHHDTTPEKLNANSEIKRWFDEISGLFYTNSEQESIVRSKTNNCFRKLCPNCLTPLKIKKPDFLGQAFFT